MKGWNLPAFSEADRQRLNGVLKDFVNKGGSYLTEIKYFI